MSTRGSLFFHHDEKSDVTIHIYEEALDRTIHIEIEHAHGTTNVFWPMKEFVDEVFRSERMCELWQSAAEYEAGPRTFDLSKLGKLFER